jgi:hypothetical protein
VTETGTVTIEFLGTNANSANNGDDNTAFIDAVRILMASASVGNAGFETPAAPFKVPPATNPLYWYGAAGATWKFSADTTNGSGIAANGSAFNNAAAPEGMQVAFIQRAGSITQEVSLAAGTYVLAFQAAQRPNNQQTFQVLVNGTVVGTFQPASTTYQAFTTNSFTVTETGTVTIEFLGTNTNSTNNGGDNTAFIDAVSALLTSHWVTFDQVAPAPVTFDGTHPVNQPVALKEHSSIAGTVFVDQLNDGRAAHGQGVAGAVVYLDLNHDGKRDDGDPTALADASGQYSFANLPAGTYTVALDLSSLPGWVQTADTPTTYPVTIDNSGYSVQEDKDFGTLPPAYIRGKVTGYPLQKGQVAPDTQPLSGWTVNLLGDLAAVQIDAGGNGLAGYEADADFSGGTPATTTLDIDTSQVFNPAPLAVYQSGRAATSDSDSFTYTLPGLTPDVAYVVRLHFAEIDSDVRGPGQRQFNVAINGVTVLTDFDIIGVAGAANTAIVRSFNAVADNSGKITITFSNGSAGVAFVNAVEVLQPNQVLATTTTDADGNYLFNRPTPGQYTVREAPPANWRQVAPFYSDPSFTQSPLPADANGNPLVTADFNGDGYVDLVTEPVLNEDTLNLFYNQKNSTFGPAEGYSLPGGLHIISAVPADLNGDGRMDIAVLLVDNTVDAFLNTGNAAPGQRFQYVPNYWTLPASVSNDTLTGLTAADLNHDGLDDVLLGATNTDQTSATDLVLLNNAQPTARTATPYDLPSRHAGGDQRILAGPIAAGDLNGDGNLDVIVNGGDRGLQVEAFNVALGDGKGGLAPWMSYQFPSTSSGLGTSNGGPLAIGDIKGDGSLSAVFFSAPSNASGEAVYSADLALNRGKGVFDVVHQQDSISNPLVPRPIDVQLKDINGDLKPDLVFLLSHLGGANPIPSSVLVYLNTGTYPYFQVQNPLLFPVGDGTTPAALDFAITDVNNDGLSDIFVATLDTSGNGGYLLLNTSPRKHPGIPVFLEAGVVPSPTGNSSGFWTWK